MENSATQHLFLFLRVSSITTQEDAAFLSPQYHRETRPRMSIYTATFSSMKEGKSRSLPQHELRRKVQDSS